MGQADHFLELMGMFSANLFKQDRVDDVRCSAAPPQYLKQIMAERGDSDNGEGTDVNSRDNRDNQDEM